jgi:hypothetical protein
VAQKNLRPVRMASSVAQIRRRPRPNSHAVIRTRARTILSFLLQGLPMCDETTTRFRSAEDALRFYFRLRELLHSGRARRLLPDDLPAYACAVAANAIDDFQSIGWCMRGLDEVALWLLSEIYGPTCFGVHRRTFSHACTAGRREFPKQGFRLREIGLLHANALGVVKRRLRRLDMIPLGRLRALRQRRRRTRIVEKRTQREAGRAAGAG